MAHQRQYYTLVASLPPIPYFEHAERLPINKLRLSERLSMLEPDDLALVERTEAVLAWEQHPMERTDAEIVAAYQQIPEHLASRSVIMQIVEYRMHVRTIMAALRRRHRGLPAPKAGEPWGIGPWVSHIERNWDAPDFRLNMVFPWIPEARQYLEDREPLDLQRLLMRLIWKRVDLLTQHTIFGFEAVLAYLVKTDILQRWLSYNREEAQTRFDALVREVIGEHDRLFD